MSGVSQKHYQKKSALQIGFIFYYPKRETNREQLYCNEEAWRVLSVAELHLIPKNDPSPDLSSLCARWKAALDKKIKGENSEDTPAPRKRFLGIF